MKHIKTYEASTKIALSISVCLFPNHNGLEENDVPTTGTWTTFWGDSHKKEIGQKYSNIIWRKYFGINDPWENKSQYGPTRPEFETYPEELINTLIYIGDNTKDAIVEIVKNKMYWKYTEPKKAPIDKDELDFGIEFSSKEDALEWLDQFEFILNDPDEQEIIITYMTAKKYNL